MAHFEKSRFFTFEPLDLIEHRFEPRLLKLEKLDARIKRLEAIATEVELHLA